VADRPLTLSLVIPAHNEAEGIAPTVRTFAARLRDAGIPFEIVVVDDNSTDGTDVVLASLHAEVPELRRVENPRTSGFGHAVIAGLESFSGDAVAIVMADASDDPADLVAYYRTLVQGYDCVFGSRFVPGAQAPAEPAGQLVHPAPLRPPPERHHQRVQVLPP
jgi:dolichol-phosphate mannosyltransferase